MAATVLTAERARADLARALGETVGLLTASVREQRDARVVVGTARRILDGEWDAVVMPDVDFLLLGSGMGSGERAFRLIHGAAQAARECLLVQTLVPDNLTLQSALRDDYPAFAVAELPRLRSVGYPPYAHLAAVTFEGPKESVRRAVESGLLPALGSGVEASELTPFASPGAGLAWRLLLRSRDRSAVARAATLAARLAAKSGKAGLKARVDVDPEEV
jgi:primosomal protein N' (replication factor Y)